MTVVKGTEKVVKGTVKVVIIIQFLYCAAQEIY